MCGRAYITYSDEELYFRYLNRKGWRWAVGEKVPSVKPNYNMCPGEKAPVVCVEDNKLGINEMRWGLVPAWAKSVKEADKYSMINAKSEEIAAKRSYAGAFRKRRCIVPVSGFFEWQKQESKKKIPFAIQLRDDPIMSLAAIWERREGEGEEPPLYSHSIVTTAANPLISKIHNRMPVILDRDDEEKWLDPGFEDISALSSLMKPCPDERLHIFEVSTLVNSPRNKGEEVLRPL